MLVGITSRSQEGNLQWLVEFVQKKCSEFLAVEYIPITNRNRLNWEKAVGACSVVILYHTKCQGWVNITDVDGSLYDEELRYLSRHPGREKVVVMLDDMDDISENERQGILRAQPSLKRLSSHLILIPKSNKTEAANKKLEELWPNLSDVRTSPREEDGACAQQPYPPQTSGPPSWLKNLNPKELSKYLPTLSPSTSSSAPVWPRSPSHSSYRVCIFSRSASSNYTWLMDSLKADPRLRSTEIKSFYIGNHYETFRSGLHQCHLAILYHTTKQGRINITDVTNSLYDKELREMSEYLGRENVIVVIDDLENIEPKAKDQILDKQFSIRNYAKDLFLFTEKNKHATNPEQMQEIIQHSFTKYVARLGASNTAHQTTAHRGGNFFKTDAGSSADSPDNRTTQDKDAASVTLPFCSKSVSPQISDDSPPRSEASKTTPQETDSDSIDVKQPSTSNFSPTIRMKWQKSQQENEELKRTIKKQKETIKILQKNVSQEETIKELKAENVSQEKTIEKLKEANVSKEETIKELKAENVCQEETIKKLKEENVSQGETIEELKAEKVSHEETIKELIAKNVSQQETIENLKEKNAFQEETIEKLKEENVSQEETIKELIAKNVSQQETIDKQKEKNVFQEEITEKLKEKNVSQEETIRKLKEENVSQEITIKKLKEETFKEQFPQMEINTKLKDENVFQEETTKKLKEETIKELKEKNVSQEETNTKLKEENISQEKTINNLKEESASQEETNKKLKEEHVSQEITIKKLKEETFKELKEENVSQMETNTKQKDENVSQEETNTKLKEENVYHEEIFEKLKEENISQEEIIKNLKEESVSQEETNKKLKEENVSQEITIKKLKEDTFKELKEEHFPQKVKEENVSQAEIIKELKNTNIALNSERDTINSFIEQKEEAQNIEEHQINFEEEEMMISERDEGRKGQEGIRNEEKVLHEEEVQEEGEDTETKTTFPEREERSLKN